MHAHKYTRHLFDWRLAVAFSEGQKERKKISLDDAVTANIAEFIQVFFCEKTFLPPVAVVVDLLMRQANTAGILFCLFAVISVVYL